jgi:hypothetical protein
MVGLPNNELKTWRNLQVRCACSDWSTFEYFEEHDGLVVVHVPGRIQ